MDITRFEVDTALARFLHMFLCSAPQITVHLSFVVAFPTDSTAKVSAVAIAACSISLLYGVISFTGVDHMRARDHWLAPTVHQVTPLPHQITPLAHQVTPLSHQITPLAHQVTPLPHRITPLAHQITPLAHWITPLARMVLTLWHVCVLVSRVLAFSLFSYVYGALVFIVVGVHWSVMFGMLVVSRTLYYCRQTASSQPKIRWFAELPFESIASFGYVFVFFNAMHFCAYPHLERTCVYTLHLVVFLLLTWLENITMVILFFVQKQAVWYALGSLPLVIGFPVMGLLLLLVHNIVLDPAKTAQWNCRGMCCCGQSSCSNYSDTSEAGQHPVVVASPKVPYNLSAVPNGSAPSCADHSQQLCHLPEASSSTHPIDHSSTISGPHSTLPTTTSELSLQNISPTPTTTASTSPMEVIEIPVRPPKIKNTLHNLEANMSELEHNMWLCTVPRSTDQHLPKQYAAPRVAALEMSSKLSGRRCESCVTPELEPKQLGPRPALGAWGLEGTSTVRPLEPRVTTQRGHTRLSQPSHTPSRLSQPSHTPSRLSQPSHTPSRLLQDEYYESMQGTNYAHPPDHDSTQCEGSITPTHQTITQCRGSVEKHGFTHPPPPPPLTVLPKALICPTQRALSSAQRAPHSIKVTPCSAQRAPHSIKVTPCSAQRAPHGIKVTPCSAQRAPHGIKVTPCSAQRAPHSIKVTPCSAQRAPHSIKVTHCSAQRAPHSIKVTPCSAQRAPARCSNGVSQVPLSAATTICNTLGHNDRSEKIGSRPNPHCRATDVSLPCNAADWRSSVVSHVSSNCFSAASHKTNSTAGVHGHSTNSTAGVHGHSSSVKELPTSSPHHTTFSPHHPTFRLPHRGTSSRAPTSAYHHGHVPLPNLSRTTLMSRHGPSSHGEYNDDVDMPLWLEATPITQHHPVFTIPATNASASEV